MVQKLEFSEIVISILNIIFEYQLYFISCFPHIVNLACKAALAAITDLFYIDDTVEHYQDYEPSVHRKDCIATIRSLVNAVCIF